MELKEIYRATTSHFLTPIRSLLEDDSVSEVMINGHDRIYFERSGKLNLFDGAFPSESALMAAARNIAEYTNRDIGGDSHSMDARLPDGSRVHVIVPPSSRQGVCITIRKFKKSSFDLDQLARWGSITDEVGEFLRIAVQAHQNTIISGGTGTGKTSMLNAVSTAIAEDERIVVIEDSSELQLYQPHTVYLEAQPPHPDGRPAVTIRDLFVDSLRMRPDRIIVGEVRRGEALDLIQSMLSGHSGSLATVHANNARDAAIRLETLCLMSDVALPVYVARTQVASAIHLVVQLARMSDGSRKVTAISECSGLDAQNNYVFDDLYRFDAQGTIDGKVQGELQWTRHKPRFAADVKSLGLGEHVERTSALFA